MKHLDEYRKFIPTRYILLGFLAGLFINMIPSGGLLPDVVALLLLYWLIINPEQINLGIAFIMGLIMDVATFSLLGQHALAYTVTSYIVLRHWRKISLFGYGTQTLVALGILLLNHLIISLIGYLYSGKPPLLESFLPVFIGAFSWPLLNKLMIFIYRPRSSR
jgi:rod shape-determining protein MreD